MLLIQIGLGMTQEFKYLVRETFPDIVSGMREQDKEFWIPPDIQSFRGDWKYIGVDMTPMYVDVANKAVPAGRFYNYAVVENPQEPIEHKGWRCDEHDGYHIDKGVWGYTGETYTTPCVTLNELFNNFGNPDALVMDVENHEIPILRGYDWSHKPMWLKIEMHSLMSANTLIPDILARGYTLILFQHSNGGNTSDAQFILTDNVLLEHVRYEYGRKD